MPTVLGDVAVTVEGSGPALLLWPSLLMTGSLWAAQVARFAPTHTVIAVDPPGHGASAPLRSAFTFEQCAQVIEQLLDHLGMAVDVASARWAVTSVVPRRPDQRALLPTISARMLVVAGQEDRTFPVPEVRIVADGIPGARLVVLDAAAHLAALEVPDRVNALIAEHLAEAG